MHTVIESPVGPLTLVNDEGVLVGLYFEGHRPAPPLGRLGESVSTEPFNRTIEQLTEYFSGKRHLFDIPYRFIGTDFQQQVWTALAEIPYGRTVTYSHIAEQIGRPTASRAVGAAVGRNPLSIVVGCHRVVGATGLTGYAGGLDRKRHLLALESSAH